MSTLSLFKPQTNPVGVNQDEYSLRKFKLFNVALAIAVLFDLASNDYFSNGLHLTLLSLAAIFLLMKPSSLPRVCVSLLLLLYWGFKNMPSISNHLLFNCFVALSIIQALLFIVLKNKSLEINKGQLLDAFAPMVRVELIILYFYVVFHKLNSGFFSPEGSCAVSFMEAQGATSFLPLSNEFLLLNAYATIFIEALIPLLLIFRKTRNWGLLLGLGFHFIIAYNPRWGFYDISSSIFAAYVLFVDRKFVDKVYGTGEWVKSVYSSFMKPQVPFRLAQLGLFIALFLFGFALIHLLTKQFEDYFRYVLWTLYSVSFITIFLLAMLQSREKVGVQDQKGFSLLHWSFIVLPVLVFINGLSPYLGLKTEASFAMFSNLRTEGNQTNHYLIPVQSQIFEFQKDLVEIVSSTDPKLQQLAEKEKLVVFFKFKHMVGEERPEMVEYIRNGERKIFQLKEASAGDELLSGNPFLLRKLLNFRHISKHEPQPCEH